MEQENKPGYVIGPELHDHVRTMRIVLGVTIVNTDAAFDDAEATRKMEERVLTAILPDPDDGCRTGHGDETVTVIAEDWETT